jgi:hypothetical protein
LLLFSKRSACLSYFKELNMAEITAALVKDLRETTGAGMMDCKKALVESDGDMQGAIDWLRKKGLSAAAKKSGRVAAEGLIGIALAPGRAAMVEINLWRRPPKSRWKPARMRRR